MKILITGGTGLLGKALVDTVLGTHEIVATYYRNRACQDSDNVKYIRLDIRDGVGYGLLFNDFKPDVTIHAAGIGSPDYAERHREETSDVNIAGVKGVVSNCERYNSKLIYISSNGIYDGEKAPYNEDAAANPINFYGKIKLEGERIAKSSKLSCSIVRPILMYGWNYSFERFNIVTLAISKLRKGEKVYAYDDVYVKPLYAENCAKAVWKIVDEEKYGVYNISGKDRLSIFGLLKKVANIFELDEKLVCPVQQGYFNELVKRPKDTSYDTAKMEEVLGVNPIGAEEGLGLMKKARGAL